MASLDAAETWKEMRWGGNGEWMPTREVTVHVNHFEALHITSIWPDIQEFKMEKSMLPQEFCPFCHSSLNNMPHCTVVRWDVWRFYLLCICCMYVAVFYDLWKQTLPCGTTNLNLNSEILITWESDSVIPAVSGAGFSLVWEIMKKPVCTVLSYKCFGQGPQNVLR